MWQLERREQRRSRNDVILARLSLPPLDLPRDLDATVDPAYRKASVTGTFDPAHEIFLGSRSRDGVSGVHVVTPLRMDGADVAVLVDRGWIADEVLRNQPSETWAVAGPVTVSGLLRPSQPEPSLGFLADQIPPEGGLPLRTWRVLNVEGIARQIPYPLLDVFLEQENPAPHGGAPLPAGELDLSEGSHLGYAIQWFAFAAIAWIGAVFWLRSRRS